MKISNVFGKTLRENQKDADVDSYNFLLRAGYIRQLASGIFSYLHFGQRSIRKIEEILRQEMNAIGGDEICMPIVHPAEIWKTTNRWYEIDESLVRFKDRGERDMVLAMTHEEVVADLTRSEIDSYKNLPKLVYQIYTKFRDEARARGGLIRVREFTMKDSYSLDKDYEGLEKQYIAHYDAYFRIFSRCGMPVVAVLSDTGMMGGKIAHEYMYLTPIGEDTIFICDSCGYKANKEVAKIRKDFAKAEPKPLEKVHTPDTKTIQDLAALLNVAESDCAKAVFFSGKLGEEQKVVMALVPGNMEANAVKIERLLKLENMRAATDAEILATGAVPGYASPIGVDRSKIMVIADELVCNNNNLVAGANEEHYHYRNTCYGRDYTADHCADIVSAFDGAPCPQSQQADGVLRSARGIEVGNIFQLGIKYTAAMNAYFIDEDGVRKPVVMGSYGIGVGRILACACEEHHDERGLMLPISIAPYEVAIVTLPDTENESILPTAMSIYEALWRDGIDTIIDDRDRKVATTGERFADADLIGAPIRLTVSKKSLAAGGVELKLRKSGHMEIVPQNEVLERVKQYRRELYQELETRTKNAETWK